ncbi:MAG TPA: hypothetical protein VGG33_22035, partial [Polyangia bacterium]
MNPRPQATAAAPAERAVTAVDPDPGVAAIDCGALALGGGMLALVRPTLARLAPGGVLAVLSSAPSTAEDLPAWCRLERHEYLGRARLPDGRDQHLVRRGRYGVATATDANQAAPAAHENAAHFPSRLAPGVPPRTRDLVAHLPMPAHADPNTGFAPRGAAVEPGGPTYPFTLLDRDRVAPPETAELYEQAVAAHWDASRDIPWRTAKPLPPALARALAQVMTFLAENELSALYVPSRFLGR